MRAAIPLHIFLHMTSKKRCSLLLQCCYDRRIIKKMQKDEPSAYYFAKPSGIKVTYGIAQLIHCSQGICLCEHKAKIISSSPNEMIIHPECRREYFNRV